MKKYRKLVKKIIQYVVILTYKKNKNILESFLCFLYTYYKKIKNIFLKSENKFIADISIAARNIHQGSWRYVTYQELVAWTTQWIRTFDETYDVVVGVPRSGLVVASIVATKLGKPLSTPDQFPENIWKSKKIASPQQIKILLIDDSVASGKSLTEAHNNLLKKIDNTNVTVTTAALIVDPEKTSIVDMFYKEIPKPRIFEWNLMHADKGVLAVDMDGVLCADPPELVERDTAAYIAWMQSVRPYLIPAFPIDVIITSRLEKYRKETEAWLLKHGVTYKKLVMWDLAHHTQRKEGNRARHKVETLLAVKPFMYWESSQKDAEYIFEKTKIPVWCVDKNVLYSK